MNTQTDWYENRGMLEPGMIFTTTWGDKVMLEHRDPGDGTNWIVADWVNGHWSHDENTIHPGDLAELIAND